MTQQLSNIARLAKFRINGCGVTETVTCNDFRGDVTAMIGERPYNLYVRETPDVFLQLDPILGKDAYWVTANGRVLRPTVEWAAYGFDRKVTITVHPRLRGGSSVVRIKMHEDYFAAPRESPITAGDLTRIANKAGFPWIKTFSARAKEFEYTKGYYNARPKYEGVGPFDGEWMTFSCKGEINKSVS